MRKVIIHNHFAQDAQATELARLQREIQKAENEVKFGDPAKRTHWQVKADGLRSQLERERQFGGPKDAKLNAEDLEVKMVKEHAGEIRRKRAQEYNFGWAMTGTSIASKTSEGILESSIDPKTGKVTHEWG